MGKRLFLSLAALTGLLLAADGVEPHVSFSSASKVGPAFLLPGLYNVRVQGNLLFLTDATTKKSYTAVVHVEKLPKPASFTAAQGRNVDGVQRVEAIVIQGSDVRIVF